MNLSTYSLLMNVDLATSAQRRCHPQEALYLPTFSHLLIVNKLLSLSLSLSRPPASGGPTSSALAWDEERPVVSLRIAGP